MHARLTFPDLLPFLESTTQGYASWTPPQRRRSINGRDGYNDGGAGGGGSGGNEGSGSRGGGGVGDGGRDRQVAEEMR